MATYEDGDGYSYTETEGFTLVNYPYIGTKKTASLSNVGWMQPFEGDLSIIRAYNDALDATEILQNYNTDAAAYIPEPVTFAMLAFGAGGVLLKRKRD